MIIINPRLSIHIGVYIYIYIYMYIHTHTYTHTYRLLFPLMFADRIYPIPESCFGGDWDQSRFKGFICHVVWTGSIQFQFLTAALFFGTGSDLV